MNATLCCPGPSLAEFPGRHSFDYVACVNRAALTVCPDVWCALDLPMILSASPHVGVCEVLTNAATLESLQRRKHLRSAGSVALVEWLACPVSGWSRYSATAALVLLSSRGVKSVRCYGVDWTGDRDFDGVAAGENRSEQRWRAERAIWGGVVEWMQGLGISVERVRPVAV